VQKNQKIFPQYTTVAKEPITICKMIDAKAFEYPFFNEGVNKSRTEKPNREIYKLQDIPDLDETKLLEVKGFIFHTSHCGSTLLSRMLHESPEIRVVSETEAINGLLLAHILNELPERETAKHLKAIIDAYRQPLGEEKYLIFKLTSWSIFLANLFQEIYPTTPWIYIDRETKEVVHSLKNSNGGMEQWWDHPVDILRKYFVDKNHTCNSKEAYLTHMVEQHRKHASIYKNEHCCSLSYPNFLTEFEEKILPHFTLNFSAKEIEAAKKLLLFDSKSFEKKVWESC